MKKFLTHFQNYLLASATLLYSVSAVLPNPTNLITQSSANTEVSVAAPDPDEADPLDPPAPPLEDDPEETETFDFESDLIIRAVNPGYPTTVNDKSYSNVGEFVELLNLTDDSLELAGYAIKYVSDSAPDSPPKEVFTFPDGSYMAGKHLLLRFDHKTFPEPPSDLTYKLSTYGFAQGGGTVLLTYQDEPVNSLCWNKKGENGCATKSSDNYDTIVRQLDNTFEYVPHDEYDFPVIDPENPSLFLPEPSADDDDDPPEEEKPAPQCRGLEFSELLAYYEADKSEQFIEFFNPTREEILLDGCKINYKNKSYSLSGKVPSGGYFAYYQSEQFALTKNPKNPLTLTLIDADDEILDEIAYPNGQKKSTSYAKTFDEQGNDLWQITYAITPNSENIYQKFRSCEDGKVINEATGNCVKVTSIKSIAEQLQTSSTLAPCPAGKYRNPLTGRCKNIESTTSTLKECAEGYERNPETNRCRKVTSTSGNSGADYALVPNTSGSGNKTVFVGLGIVLLIVTLGVTYIILQFRREIVRAARKAGQRLNHIREHLLTRRIGRHRDK